MAEENLQDVTQDTNPLSNYQSIAQKYNEATSQLNNALTQPQQVNMASVLAAMARPTPTGQMDYGAGGAELGRQQTEIQKQVPQNIAMRVSLLKNQMDLAKQAGVRNIAQNLLTPTQTMGEDGKPKTSYSVNPQAINNLMQLSDNPFEDLNKYASAIPNLRKAGLLGSKETEGTPFDALSLMVKDPLIKAQSELYAKQYKTGSMDDEKANALAKDMMTMYTSHMDRQQQMEFNQAFKALSNSIAQGQLMIAQQSLELKQDANRRKNEEELKKLSPEQQITYKQVIVPILKQGTNANQALSELDSLQGYVNQLPDSIIGNIKTLVPGSPSATALREVESTTKRLQTLIPRLPGSQSNFDARNLELSLGRLQDPLLSKKQRLQILDTVKKSFTTLSDDATRYEDYWETNRKIAPPKNKVVNLNDIPSEKGQ